MYPTFSGSARSKRQVNLSGRTTNPFAAHGSSNPSTTTQTAHSAIAHAQHERVLREQERRRPPAASKIQRTWRGHRSRNNSRRQWRQQWDAVEGGRQQPNDAQAYETATECLTQLRVLAQFASYRSEDDIRRVCYYARRYFASRSNWQTASTEEWLYPSFRLARTLIQILEASKLENLHSQDVYYLSSVLTSLTLISGPYIATYSLDYYRAVKHASGFCQDPKCIQQLVLALPQGARSRIQIAYEGFAWIYLQQESLPGFPDDVLGLSRYVQYQPLARALVASLSTYSNQQLLQMNEADGLLWMLSYFIHFHQHPRPGEERNTLPDVLYVKVVSRIISALSDHIESRIDNFDMRTFSSNAVSEGSKQTPVATKLPDFIRSQILSLIGQEKVGGLLARLEADAQTPTEDKQSSSEASALASYVLTLMKVFPRRRSDIQMWLYRGSAVSQEDMHTKLPANKYLYQATRTSQVFRLVSLDPKQAIQFLTPDRSAAANSGATPSHVRNRDQEWRVILLFLELYSFILQVMDDEEFLSGTSWSNPTSSLPKQSALPLPEVESLSIFLKNLAFALYWYPSQIAGEQEQKKTQGLAAYFGKGETFVEDLNGDQSIKMDEYELAGVSGMTVESLKVLVVGVLRMIYQRDSRRRFLPKDHWLMTKYFEMDKFIASVVEEQEHSRKIEESFDADDVQSDHLPRDQPNLGQSDEAHGYDSRLIGNQRTRQLRRVEQVKLYQRDVSRRRYLESVTPRLRILENTPFFIPFHTRVQIFRQFVELDQVHRRGTSDADEWRYAQMNSVTGNIGRHRATVRREHIFDDAYKQYYDLAEGLKEPIQIRFVDKFDTVEEGIDGGGVTKEFLTSVTNEAFGGANGLEALFMENEQNSFYPNPAAVEERKETLRQALFREGSPDWNETIRDLLRRYEFLGRLIGKCLYEGILIDIHFAPFFLLKWALTGGLGSGRKESGYRANLNDLRDLDEGVYQGLLQLKNYPGNVQEDFALDFTVTDTLRLSPTQTKAVTRELRPGGSDMAVTNGNRLVYITAMARHRLQNQPEKQTSAFLRGLGTIITPSWLSMFNQSELQTLIGGSGGEVSIADLRANTQYGGVYEIGDDNLEHPSIRMFWKVLQEMSSDDVAKVLKFVTSTPRAPLLGFGNLNPKFSIRDSGADQTRLPSTSTCVNLLKLPIYKDEKVLKERLLYSVNAGAGFNLS